MKTEDILERIQSLSERAARASGAREECLARLRRHGFKTESEARAAKKRMEEELRSLETQIERMAARLDTALKEIEDGL